MSFGGKGSIFGRGGQHVWNPGRNCHVYLIEDNRAEGTQERSDSKDASKATVKAEAAPDDGGGGVRYRCFCSWTAMILLLFCCFVVFTQLFLLFCCFGSLLAVWSESAGADIGKRANGRRPVVEWCFCVIKWVRMEGIVARRYFCWSSIDRADPSRSLKRRIWSG